MTDPIRHSRKTGQELQKNDDTWQDLSTGTAASKEAEQDALQGQFFSMEDEEFFRSL